jgi:hypothetical protein
MHRRPARRLSFMPMFDPMVDLFPVKVGDQQDQSGGAGEYHDLIVLLIANLGALKG